MQLSMPVVAGFKMLLGDPESFELFSIGYTQGMHMYLSLVYLHPLVRISSVLSRNLGVAFPISKII